MFRAGVGLIFSPGVSCLRQAHLFVFVLAFSVPPLHFLLLIFYLLFFARISPTMAFFFIKVLLSGESKDNYFIISVAN